jgi:single-strand DNA-binding protein
MTPYSFATVEGFATSDPKVRTTKTQKKVATFSMSILHYSRIDESPRISFVDIEGWERVADDIELDIKKGQRVMVIGTIRQDRWETETGKMNSRIKIVAQEIRLIQRG